MKSFPAIFAFVFIGLAISWYGLLVRGSAILNPANPDLKTTLTVGRDEVVIPASEGLPGQGQQVYRELGCVMCHTQQVRRPGYGGDFDREWGSRQSVARDYLLQDVVLTGGKRIGPDLSNVGARREGEWLYRHLYNPAMHSKATTMPAYKFLFREKEIAGNPEANALELEGNLKPKPGYEIVPTEKAEALVAYLKSLQLDYDLPESKRIQQ